MKNILITVLFCISFFITFSQKNHITTIRGYVNNEHLYFDSLNKLWNKDISCSAIPCWVFVSFKVDTSSTVIDLNMTSIPNRLPETMKVYVRKMIESTNGKWIIGTKDGKKVASENMGYQFDFMKAGLSLAERMEEGKEIFEYYVTEGYKNEMIRRFDDSKHKKIFSIMY